MLLPIKKIGNSYFVRVPINIARNFLEVGAIEVGFLGLANPSKKSEI
jgi:hypothetical protein